MKQLPSGWSQQDGRLKRRVTCKDFKAAVALLNTIGEIAEQQNHHPDLTITDYKQLSISITTHIKGGLTDRDFELAQAITRLLDSRDN